MLTAPDIAHRPDQPYIYVPFTVTMRQMQRPATQGFPQLFAYLEKHGLKPASAPFYNYRRIDMARTLDVEAGIAVEEVGPGDGNIQHGILPEGSYAGLTWTGHPDKLRAATADLLGWLEQTGRPLDMEERTDGDHFVCRLEIYESDPDEVPDMNQWVTRLAFKLRG